MTSSGTDPLNIVITGSSNDTDIILESANSSILNGQDGSGLLLGRLVDLETSLNSNSVNDLALKTFSENNASNITANLNRLDVHEGLVTQNIADISINKSNIQVNMKSINQMNTLLSACASRAEVTSLKKKLETYDYDPVFNYPVHNNNFVKATMSKQPLRISNVDNETVNELVTMYNNGLSSLWSVEQVNKVNKMGLVMNSDNIITNTDTLDNLNKNNLMNVLPLRDFTLDYKFSVVSKTASARHFMFNINVSGDSYISNILDMTDLSTCSVLPNNSSLFSGSNNFDENTFYNVKIIKVSNTMSVSINGTTFENIFSNVPSQAIHFGFLANPNIIIKGVKLNIVKANILDGYSEYILDSYSIGSLPDKNIVMNGWYDSGRTTLELFEIVAGVPKPIFKTDKTWGSGKILSTDGKYLACRLYPMVETPHLLLYDISSGALKYVPDVYPSNMSPVHLNGTNGINLYLFDTTNKILKHYSFTGISDEPVLTDYPVNNLPESQFKYGVSTKHVRAPSNYFLVKGLNKVYVINLEGKIVTILDPSIEITNDNYETIIEGVTGELYNGHLYIGIKTAMYNTITSTSATGTSRGPNLIPPERAYSQLLKADILLFDENAPPSNIFSVIEVERGNYETGPTDKILNSFTNSEGDMMNISSNVVVIMNRKSGFRYYDVYSLKTIDGKMKMVFSGRVNAPKDDLNGGFVNKVCICKDYMGSNGTGEGGYLPSAFTILSINSIIDSPDNNFYAPSFLTDTSPETITRPVTVDPIPIHPMNTFIGAIETNLLLTVSGDLLLGSNISYSNMVNSLKDITNNEITTFNFNGVKYTWDLGGTKTYKGDDNSILTYYFTDEIHNVMGTTPKQNGTDFYTSGFVILKDGVSTVYSGYFAPLDGSDPNYVYGPYTWIWDSPSEYGILFQNGSRINTTYSVSDFFQTTEIIGWATTKLTWHNPPMTQFVYYAYATPGTLTISGDNPITINKDSNYNDVGANVNILDTDGTITLTSTSDVDTSVVGTYNVTYIASVNLIPSYIDSGYWGPVATATITKTRVVNVI